MLTRYETRWPLNRVYRHVRTFTIGLLVGLGASMAVSRSPKPTVHQPPPDGEPAVQEARKTLSELLAAQAAQGRDLELALREQSRIEFDRVAARILGIESALKSLAYRVRSSEREQRALALAQMVSRSSEPPTSGGEPSLKTSQTATSPQESLSIFIVANDPPNR